MLSETFNSFRKHIFPLLSTILLLWFTKIGAIVTMDQSYLIWITLYKCGWHWINGFAYVLLPVSGCCNYASTNAFNCNLVVRVLGFIYVLSAYYPTWLHDKLIPVNFKWKFQSPSYKNSLIFFKGFQIILITLWLCTNNMVISWIAETIWKMIYFVLFTILQTLKLHLIYDICSISKLPFRVQYFSDCIL